MNTIVFFVIKLLIAGAVALWLYRDSRARDYSHLLWTLLPLVAILGKDFFGLFYLPFIVIIYLILRPKGALINCPRCNKKIHEILTICPFCRKDAKRECLHCHEPVPWEAEQCPYCKSRAITKG